MKITIGYVFTVAFLIARWFHLIDADYWWLVATVILDIIMDEKG